MGDETSAARASHEHQASKTGAPPTERREGATSRSEETGNGSTGGNVRSAGRDFGLLWIGQTISLLGDQFVLVALPLMAVTTLGASAAQAALLPFAYKLPFLVLGLPAGAVIDRARRRPMLLSSEFVQCACFALIGVLALIGALPFWALMVIIAVSGTVSVFFQVAYTSYLPSLIDDSSVLHRANARLQFSESASRSVGPALVGPLIAVTGPAGAMLANAGSFLVSGSAILGIRHREPPVTHAPREKGWLRREIREGLGFVFRHPVLQPILLCGTAYVLFQSIVISILVLYCLQVLHLGATSIGLVVGAAALGYPAGNLVSNRVVERIGQLRAIVLGASTSVTGFILIPIFGSAGLVIGLVAGSIVHGIGEGIFGPTWTTLRQTVTPPELLGRVNSVERFLLWGAVPLASLAASGLIAVIGLSGALWVGAVGTTVCLPPLLRRGVLSGLRRSTSPGDP
jgi:MFS family permease